MAIEIQRRKFLAGLVGLVAAPAVVKASSLMRVKSAPQYVTLDWLDESTYIRGLEETEFLEGMSQTIVHEFLYTDPEWIPIRYRGVELYLPARLGDGL